MTEPPGPPGPPPPIPPSGSISETSPPNPVPFVVALVGFVVIAVLAFVYLRDDPGRLVAPDRIEVTGTDTVRLTYEGPFDRDHAEVTQVGYAIGEDEILVELVLDEQDCADDAACAETTSVAVELVLPEPIDGRDVRPGTGRALAECERSATRTTCG